MRQQKNGKPSVPGEAFWRFSLAFYTRPGVSYSPVSDIPPNQVCLAWEATRRSPLIQDFAVTAADHLPVADRS